MELGSLHIENIEYLAFFDRGAGEIDELKAKLDQLLEGQAEIMATQQQLTQALSDINDATNAQAEKLTALGSSLQNISSDIEKLILDAQASGVQNEALFSGLTAVKDKLTANGEKLAEHAAFSEGIAAVVTDPVPVPVPEEPVAQ